MSNIKIFLIHFFSQIFIGEEIRNKINIFVNYN